jgi:NarL family two-component system sensor histidine kinase YdfH
MRYNAVMAKIGNPDKKFLKVENETRFFVWFMTFVLVGVSIFTISQNPKLQKPGWLVLFTGLMILHIALHWALGSILLYRRGAFGYVVVQSLLAFSITYLANNQMLIWALYMALIGEGIGFLGLNRWGLLHTAYFLILSLSNYFIITGGENLFLWAAGILPAALFVGIYVTLYLRQFEARAQAQDLSKSLEEANRQLSAYAAQVEDLTLLAERQRMARELHDTLSQGLAGLILQLEAADAHLANARLERARLIVQQTMERARLTLADARKAIGDLRQEAVEPEALAPALRQEVERFAQDTGISCELQFEPSQDIPAGLHDTILRTVSEGLSNIARHARAQKTAVMISVKGQMLQVEIRDDGIGFDPRSAFSQSGHYGLVGLRERAQLVGGTLEVGSRVRGGTILSLRLPLHGGNDA